MKLDSRMVSAILDENNEVDFKVEEATRTTVTRKEIRQKSDKDRGEVIGNNHGVQRHRKF